MLLGSSRLTAIAGRVAISVGGDVPDCWGETAKGLNQVFRVSWFSTYKADERASRFTPG
jgi:hypothetical protein